MTMEGYVEKWTNMVYRWKKRYLVLDGLLLKYFKKKDSPKYKSYSMDGATIEMSPTEPLKLTLQFKDANTLFIKTKTISQKISWVNALRLAQENSQKQKQFSKISKDSNLNRIQGTSSYPQSNNLQASKRIRNEELSEKEILLKGLRRDLTNILKNKVLNENSKINSYLNDVATSQIQLQEAATEFQPLLSKIIQNSNSEEQLKELSILSERIINYSLQLKVNKQLQFHFGQGIVTETVQEIEEAKVEVLHAVKSLIKTNNFKNPKKIKTHGSFQEELSLPLIKVRSENNLIIQEERKDSSDFYESFESSNYSQDSFMDDLFQDAAEKSIITEPEEVKVPVSQEIRYTLPIKRDPKKKTPFWTVLKDMIGKDLTKMPLPVYFNEPISMLQKTAEVMINEELLNNACNESNSLLRLANIAAFFSSQYVSVIGRNRKPFNPLLGETFEFITANYKLFCEQVSHHPPISALHVENEDYLLYSNTLLKSKFWGKCVKVKLLAPMHIVLKKFNEHYTLEFPVTEAHNVIIGKLYLDETGEIKIINHTLNERAICKFKPRGWHEKNLGNWETVAQDSHDGIQRIEIKGKWWESISLREVGSEKWNLLWTRKPWPEDWEYYYYFNHFTLQLNYLPEKMRNEIAPTDSRLRPDQRALENGELKFASSEKYRLEEKQRKARRLREINNIDYKPIYFLEKIDPITNSKVFIFNGQYWKDKETKNWSKLPDIF